MSEGVSVDWGRVQSIANSAANSAARGVHNDLAPQIRRLESELNRLRQEMSQIANAIAEMSREMRSDLKAIHKLSEKQLAVDKEQLDAQRTTAQTSTQILTANVAGFATSVFATNATTAATDRSTSALVEVEYLRLYNEARAPLRFIEEFASEITERFAKAIEGVHVNRELYDEHFRRIFDESENKVRTIGEHIFRIIEEDFDPTVQQRLEVPRSTYQNLALEVDAKRISERSRQLDADLRTLFVETLAPLLEMHHRFETELAANYAVDIGPSVGEMLLPAAVAVSDDGGCELYVGCRIEGTPDGPNGRSFRITQDERYAATREAIGRVAAAGLSERLKTRRMNEEELAELLVALEGLAEAGRIDAKLLPGYREYLQHYGLECIVSGSELNFDPRDVPPVG